jgi:3-oxoacyl-[acyl-carrier-protein] synthase III
MKKEIPYNPLDKNNLGASVADALLERSKVDLEDVDQFIGAGIYPEYCIKE